MKEGQKLFRTSLFGFKKEDVFHYVEELNTRLTDSEERASVLTGDCKDKSEKLRVALQKGEEDAARQVLEIQSLSQALESAKGEASAAAAEAAKLRFQTEQDRIRLTDYAKRLQEYEEKIAELHEKAEKYDRQMSKISEVMVLVRTEAETILSDARAEAETIRTTALAEAEKTNGLIESFKEKYNAVKTAFATSLDDMKGMFEDTYDKVGETVKAVEPLPAEWLKKLSEEEDREQAGI